MGFVHCGPPGVEVTTFGGTPLIVLFASISESASSPESFSSSFSVSVSVSVSIMDAGSTLSSLLLYNLYEQSLNCIKLIL